MSFSTIPANPTWGTLLTTQQYLSGDITSFGTNLYSSAGLLASSLSTLGSGAVDTSGITKPFAGWITYTGGGGGGGGSTRPTSGMIYPRGSG